jgi:hypothetical protein
VKLIGSGGMRAVRTLFVLATAAGLSLAAACTSGTTANCSPGEGGTPNSSAWCGEPAGDAELPDSTTEAGTGDSTTETGAPETGSPETGSPETGSETGSKDTGAPDGALDAPKG